jgi:hypothetical protein
MAVWVIDLIGCLILGRYVEYKILGALAALLNTVQDGSCQ